jgi:hypothetical protein
MKKGGASALPFFVSADAFFARAISHVAIVPIL